VNHFIENLRSNGMPLRGITDESLDLLKRYSWPGNVRELENVIERAATLGSGEIIETGDLPSQIQDGEGPKTVPPKSLKSVELDAIRNALEKSSGDIAQAAKMLDIHRSTLYRKMKRHGLTQSGLKQP